jgi:hypothetical protein
MTLSFLDLFIDRKWHLFNVLNFTIAGNTGASETITFTITEPLPTTLGIVSVIVVAAVVGLGLLVHPKKRQKLMNV